jgi:hypothetical protein
LLAAAFSAAAAFLTLLACGEASAGAVDVAFQFEGDGVTYDSAGFHIEFLSLTGPITKNNIDLVLLGTTLDLTDPLPAGVGDTLTLGWYTLAGTFSDPLTEISAKGSPNSLLTIVAMGMISGASQTGSNYGPTRSQLTLTFADGSLSGTFTTLASATSVPPAVPELSSWAMLLTGFAGLGALGLSRARKADGWPRG